MEADLPRIMEAGPAPSIAILKSVWYLKTIVTALNHPVFERLVYKEAETNDQLQAV